VVTVIAFGTLVVGTLEGSNVSITGDVNAGNVVSVGFVQAATVSASGNVTGGNVTTGGLITATGNIQGGNLRTTGLVSATANVIGGNITTAGTVSAATVAATSFSAGNAATVTTANYTIGYRDLPQITSFGTLATTDGGKHYYGSGTITVPTNGAVSLPVGTAVLIIATNSTTINASGGVTLRWGGTSGTGARTLAQYGVATLVKVATDTWFINGTGVV
jgi:hypothetical protein